jgi:hypothetical protein
MDELSTGAKVGLVVAGVAVALTIEYFLRSSKSDKSDTTQTKAPPSTSARCARSARWTPLFGHATCSPLPAASKPSCPRARGDRRALPSLDPIRRARPRAPAALKPSSRSSTVADEGAFQSRAAVGSPPAARNPLPAAAALVTDLRVSRASPVRPRHSGTTATSMLSPRRLATSSARQLRL